MDEVLAERQRLHWAVIRMVRAEVAFSHRLGKPAEDRVVIDQTLREAHDNYYKTLNEVVK